MLLGAHQSRAIRKRPADALAIAIWAANAERPGAEELRSSVLDRASVNPMTSNAGAGNSYERAVREAIAREKTAQGASRRKG